MPTIEMGAKIIAKVLLNLNPSQNNSLISTFGSDSTLCSPFKKIPSPLFFNSISIKIIPMSIKIAPRKSPITPNPADIPLQKLYTKLEESKEPTSTRTIHAIEVINVIIMSFFHAILTSRAVLVPFHT